MGRYKCALVKSLVTKWVGSGYARISCVILQSKRSQWGEGGGGGGGGQYYLGSHRRDGTVL